MGHRPGAVALRREDDGSVVCGRCVLADTLGRRMRGLIARRELEPGEGIVLRPAWSVHTFFMRFPIDVVFVDADQIVVKVVPNLRPWHTAACRGARDVVELRAGECARLGLAAGDRLAWAARAEHRPAPPRLHAVDGRSTNRDDPSNGRARVLIASRDDRFVRLGRLLLTRKRFDVESTKRLAKAVDIVARHRCDAVVIDATESLSEAARTVAAIEALYPDVVVVVVCDGEPPTWATGVKVTEKWIALETLSDDLGTSTKAAGAWN